MAGGHQTWMHGRGGGRAEREGNRLDPIRPLEGFRAPSRGASLDGAKRLRVARRATYPRLHARVRARASIHHDGDLDSPGPDGAGHREPQCWERRAGGHAAHTSTFVHTSRGDMQPVARLLVVHGRIWGGGLGGARGCGRWESCICPRALARNEMPWPGGGTRSQDWASGMEGRRC